MAGWFLNVVLLSWSGQKRRWKYLIAGLSQLKCCWWLLLAVISEANVRSSLKIHWHSLTFIPSHSHEQSLFQRLGLTNSECSPELWADQPERETIRIFSPINPFSNWIFSECTKKLESQHILQLAATAHTWLILCLCSRCFYRCQSIGTLFSM